MPKEYIGAVDKGVQEQMENGVIAGYPVVDVKVSLYDGSYHDVDSSEMAFKVAGSMAFRDGVGHHPRNFRALAVDATTWRISDGQSHSASRM